jgi:hypothetical protein
VTVLKIETRLLVWLKGTDLYASTASLTLAGKMGFDKKLAGLKRFDFFRFEIETGNLDPKKTVPALKAVLDSQSTFYNRNKHAYSLECTWDGAGHLDGLAREEVQSRWVKDVSNSLQNNGVRNFYGKDSPKPVIFNGFSGFVAEVLVEEEDPSARQSVAAKLQGGLDGTEVSCINKATLWWLALCVPTRKEADSLAREIVITTRRDSGLLMNPNYQSAEFVAFTQIGR